MYDQKGTVIYVGKAVSLKNRVRQYFQSSKNHEPKVRAMVSHVEDIDTILTANETEALTLESNLIKQFKPRYHILLKDDKHFPDVRVDMRLDFPRIEVVRRVKKDGARYLGPYLSGIALYDSLNIVRDQFPVRHCKKDINRAIARGERPCLMHHIGKCCAPCTGRLAREEYHRILHQIISFLDGNIDDVAKDLRQEMLAASEALDFELAAHLRDRLHAIEMLSNKQTAIAAKGADKDVFACCEYKGDVLVFAVFVKNGKVVGTERFSFSENAATADDVMDEDAKKAMRMDTLAAFLKQYYTEGPGIPPEILLYEECADQEAIEQWLCTLRDKKTQIHVPLRGEKRNLTELAKRNGDESLRREEKLKQREWERGEGALAELTGLLGLDTLPARMECFDNSHIQGRDTVSSMVVFLDGKPAPKEYRRFRIKTETGGDDYAAMKEALTRRFQRAMDGDEKFSALPELLVIDGGRGQLNAAMEVQAHFGLELPAIGLAELSGRIYLPDQEEPIALPKNSAPLHLIERLRDEAHRFAITYHRGLRGKNTLYSRLDEIPGVGDKRKRILFDAYPTIDSMSQASIEELSAHNGIDRRTAQAVYAYFHQDQEG
jgi:excinuclease ABC subunit C